MVGNFRESGSPVISVVTPSFNHGEFIGDTIESVLGQGVEAIEHIIVDGGSTDATNEVLSRYPHLRLMQGPDRGQSDALNKGFASARAPIVCWLNADDYLLPGVVEKVLEVFPPAPAAMVGHYYQVDSQKRFTCSMRTPPFDSRINRHYGVVVPTSGSFYSSSIFRSGEVALDLDYRVIMDWDLYRQLDERSIPIVHSGHFHSAFRVHATNRSIAGPESDPTHRGRVKVERSIERQRFHDLNGPKLASPTTTSLLRRGLFHWNHARLITRKAVRGYYVMNWRDRQRSPDVSPAGSHK